jgi:hypothetical protein
LLKMNKMSGIIDVVQEVFIVEVGEYLGVIDW